MGRKRKWAKTLTARLRLGEQMRYTLKPADTGGGGGGGGGFDGPAELPRVLIDTTYSAPTGTTWVVNSGGNFQTALNSAALNDIIQLAAGATFTGNFTLPNKTSGSGWIYIVSSALGSLPAAGTRVGISDASNMPTIAASSGSAVTSDSSAHHYRFVGVEIAATAYVSNLIWLGVGEGNLSTQTNNITFDRCYIHGHSVNGTRRGIGGNAGSIAIVDSYLSNFKDDAGDAQTIAAWNGTGPFKLVNNYFEASGENIMFGGSDSTSAAFIPSDIEIRQNRFYKPSTWRVGDPAYEGTAWIVKNLLELKCAKRVLIEGNLIEHTWEHGQSIAVLFSPRNQNATAPWSIVSDVTFRHNVVRSSPSALAFLGTDNEQTSERMTNVTIRNNLIIDTNPALWGGDGRLFSIASGPDNLEITHNTCWQTNVIALLYADQSHLGENFVFNYNVTTFGNNPAYGVYGGSEQGTATLDEWFANYTFVGNTLAGYPSNSSLYPSGNYFPATFADTEFEDLNAGDYRLAAGSPYKGVGDGGSDLGINKTDIDTAMNGMAQTYW